MNLNSELIDMIEEFSKLPQFTSQDIARILRIDQDYFQSELLNPDSQIYIAFNKGRLMSSAEFGKKVTQLSNQGSGPAQTLLSKLRNESDINSIINYYG